MKEEDHTDSLNPPLDPARVAPTPGGRRPHIPDHELLRPIARGSYGEVWLARSIIGAYRAVKVVYREDFDHDRPFEREFEGIQNFEPVSRLHDGLVDVLQVGRNERDGCFYYVMELGDDRESGQQISVEHYQPKTLASEISAKGRLPVEECLRLGFTLADALSHLHQNGLCHRDVKPSNIIFVNGIPKLADIGLVTDIGEERSYVGTHGFIAPEGPGHPQADIYSLGKVLYEISTGKDRNDFPELPDDFDRGLDAKAFHELNEVILRACHQDVQRRYQSAKELRAELALLIGGKSIRRLRLLEHRWRLIQKVGTAAFLILALGGVIGYLVLHEKRLVAETRQRKIGGAVSDGMHRLAEGNLTGALYSFTESLRLSEGLRDREETERFRIDATLAQCPRLVRMWVRGCGVNHVEFSPTGRWVLITDEPGKAVIIDVENDRPRPYSFGSAKGLEMASLSQDGDYVVGASGDGTARIWEAATGTERQCFRHPKEVRSARFSPNGSQVITGCEDHKARLWSTATGSLLLEFARHQDAVLSARFSPSGDVLVTTSRDQTARMWDPVHGREIGYPLEHPSWVYDACFSPDGRHVVTACFDRKARVWDVATGRLLSLSLDHGDGVSSVEYSPDGRWILTASMDSTVRIWDAETLLPIALNSVLKHSARVLCAAFNPDGHRIVAGCVDGTVRLWDLAANGMMARPTADVFSPDGRYGLRITNEVAQFYDAASHRPVSPRHAIPQGLKEVAFSPKGERALGVFTNSTQSSLVVWGARSGAVLGPTITIRRTLESTCLSDNDRLLVVCDRTRVQTWDVKTGHPLSAAVVCMEPITGAQFSPDGGQMMVSCGNQVHVCSSTTGAESNPAIVSSQGVSHAEYSPEGKRLLICCGDNQLNEGSARVWNVENGQPITPPLRHRDGVLSGTFSPDGKRVATASEDFTARIWDAASGKPLVPPLVHENQVQSIVFSPDGRLVLTASSDQSMRVWHADTGEPMTPPLRHRLPLRQAGFLRDSRHFLTQASPTRMWLIDLPPSDYSARELGTLASLLSSQSPAVDLNGKTDEPALSESLFTAWRDLRAKHPGHSVVSSEETIYWHRWQADLSEKHHDWAAASFHLNRWLQIEPGSRVVEDRLKALQPKLRTANPIPDAAAPADSLHFQGKSDE